MMARIEWSVGLFLLGGMVLLGCSEDTPNYCHKTDDCPAGRVCDVVRAACVLPDGSVGRRDGSPVCWH